MLLAIMQQLIKANKIQSIKANQTEQLLTNDKTNRNVKFY